MRRQIRPLVLAAVASSMALASCGGGDGDSSDDEPIEREGPQITKTRLIERADAICTRDQARVAARLKRVPRPQQTDSEGAIILPYLQINEQAIRAGGERIEALGRPTTDAEAFDSYLDERTTAANAMRSAVAAAKRNDPGALEAALKEYGRNQAAQEAARFGFKVCGLGAGRVER